MDALKCWRWGLRYWVDQSLHFHGSTTGMCTGMCLAGCLFSSFPAPCHQYRAGPGLRSWAEMPRSLFTQNNHDLKWKDTGTLESIHISLKSIRNSCLLSKFLKSNKTWCFHISFIIILFSTRDRNRWLRI